MAEMTERVLILEDDQERIDAFLRRYPDAVVVKSASDCIERLSEVWDLIYLDDDLGGKTMPGSGREDCGYIVVLHIVEHVPEHLRWTQFIVHSANPVRAKIMVEDLQHTGYKAVHKPFVSLRTELCGED